MPDETLKPEVPKPEKITIEDFKKVHLRVAKVIEVTPHPNADRLIVLKIDLGAETRQICAGIKAFYQPEELLGKYVVVVANLQPAVLRGVESNGMMLAATDAQTKDVRILVVEKPVTPGSSVS